mmetsp:Transcript_28096/g.81215  ORF Transcript_28096/g.81215 Transcript_28096/m.81215 type:complete len:1157 (+) Transcript_28096:109-3579(+)
MLRVAAATVAPSAQAARRIRPRGRGASWHAPASAPRPSPTTSNTNVPATGSFRRPSHIPNRMGRDGGLWRYPCSRCVSTTADVEALLSSSSSSAGGNITSNGSNNRDNKSRSTRDTNNHRQHAQQHQTVKSKGERNQHRQKQRRRHKAKGAAKRSVQAGDALAAAAAAARALPDKAALLLPRATERMEAFLQSRALLPPPPSVWLRPVDGLNFHELDYDDSDDDEVLAQRIALHNDVVQLLLILRDSILGGHISPRGGRNGLVLSDLVGNVLLLLGESPPFHITAAATAGEGNAQIKRTMSPADAAAIGLDLLRRTNLDVRPDHYASAVRAACHDGRWKMASDLFSAQVNPDSAGLVPVDSTLGLDSTAELGLYAIARQSQDEQNQNGAGLSTADKVFDATLGMSIISPTDQDNYVLAAGLALGRAGEWEACVEFAKRSDNAERLGQPLVAAAMLACVECSQYDTALNVYAESTSNPSLGGSEWQWGGGFDIVHPVSRDLALRSMGRSSKGGLGAQAMDIFRNQIIEERAVISSDALLGLFMALERDGEWKTAFEILNTLLRKSGSRGSSISGEWTMVPQSIDVQARVHSSTSAFAEIGISDSMLSSIMNACNSCGEFGLALLCERMVAIQRGQTASAMAMDATNISHHTIASILLASSAGDALRSEHLVLSQMSSLCGLKCYDDAVALFDEISSQAAADRKDWRQATICAKFADTEAASLNSSMFVKSQAWKAAFRHMNRICVASRCLGEKGEDLSMEEALILADALGHCMSLCNDAGQPRAGLALAEHVFGSLHSSNENGRSLGSSIMSFLGIGEGSDEPKPNSVLGSDKFEGSDLLLSSTMRSYHLLDESADAIDLFFDTVDRISMAEKEYEHSDFVHSWNEAIALLFHESRSEEAMNLYDALEDYLKTPETFIVAAKGLLLQQNWKGISEVYTRALKEHCSSEDLALLAMKAVAEQELDGKIPTLRSIVDEVAKIEGHSSKYWIKTRYWTLKRELGWRFARLLMWWNNPNTASEEELLLAVEQLEAAKNDGIIPRNDDLRCIVRYAGSKMNRSGEDAFGSLQSSQLIELVLEAILEAQRTSLWTQPSFITSSATSLRALSANKECVQLVRDALSCGIRVSKRSLKEALSAAQDIGDSVAVEELSAAVEDLKI